MLKRLYHALIVGHRFRMLSCVFNDANPSAAVWGCYTVDSLRCLWGYTLVVLSCECGKRKQLRLMGDHRGMATDLELQELERMTK